MKELKDMTGPELLAEYWLAIIQEESVHPSHPIYYRRKKAREAVDAELLRRLDPRRIAEAMAAEREACAKIAEEYALSVSCNQDGTPCTHQRTGANITRVIRFRAQGVTK